MARDDTRKIRDVRDALDGILKEIDCGWKTMILLPERIIDKIAFCPVTGCWLWDGWDSGNGYGKVRWEGRCEMAHRVIYRLVRGEIPHDHVLDHLCRMRICVNPDHLEPVTVAENTRRGDAVLFGPDLTPARVMVS